MQRPRPFQAMLGMLLVMYGASGYLGPMLHRSASKPAPAASAPTLAFRTYHDRQVTIDLPVGWRWLAQKRDPAEDSAAYFALASFQGQNVLRESVSVRIDALNNPARRSAADVLQRLNRQRATPSDSDYRPIAALPTGSAGLGLMTREKRRPVHLYLFTQPGGDLTYVLSIGSYDERFTKAMAVRCFKSLRVDR